MSCDCCTTTERAHTIFALRGVTFELFGLTQIRITYPNAQTPTTWWINTLDYVYDASPRGAVQAATAWLNEEGIN